MMTTEDTAPRVWIGCLACYNAGRLVGGWYDGTEAGEVDPDDLHTADSRVGPTYAGHEELWVMDHEGYAGLLTGECSPAEAQQLAELIGEVDERGHPVEAYAAFADDVGREWATIERFEDAYAGEWGTEREYAEELADEMIGADEAQGNGHPFLRRYFDYDAFARDLFMSDYRSAPAPGGCVYVFRVV